MDRLPIKFEEEVLSKHNIAYAETMERYQDYSDFCVECGNRVSKYEIAGIALEEIIKNKDGNLFYNERTNSFFIECELNGYATYFYDTAFYKCIFKAVREIWE